MAQLYQLYADDNFKNVKLLKASGSWIKELYLFFKGYNKVWQVYFIVYEENNEIKFVVSKEDLKNGITRYPFKTKISSASRARKNIHIESILEQTKSWDVFKDISMSSKALTVHLCETYGITHHNLPPNSMMINLFYLLTEEDKKIVKDPNNSILNEKEFLDFVSEYYENGTLLNIRKALDALISLKNGGNK